MIVPPGSASGGTPVPVRPVSSVVSSRVVVDPLAPAVAGELVVVLEDGAAASTSEQALEARGATVERMPGDEDTLLVTTPRGVSDPVFDAIASQAPGVARVQPNYIYRATYDPTGDNRYPEQWGLPAIHAPAAWDISLGASAILVAVLDTGVDASHPDLIGRVDTALGRDFVNDDNDATDDNGHGTHVAGIIAATEGNGGTVGVAPGCRVLPVKVMAADGTGDSYDIAAGIEYAADAGARVINLSLAGPSDQLMSDAVSYARSKGCVVVAAAGNEGSPDGADYPARYEGVVGVGAVDRTGARWVYTRGGSNYGSGVDIAAPGVDILSTVPGGGYASVSGTSMASPFVAGVAALVWSVNATWSATQVEERVLSTAEALPASQQLGAGIVRADGAVGATVLHTDNDIAYAPALPSPVQGQLGVATDQDDVYRIHAEAGQQIAVSLKGSAYTDFALYMYAPGSTSVHTDAPMAQADGPTYPRAISVRAPISGDYYLQAHAQAGEGTYSLIWSVKSSAIVVRPAAPARVTRRRTFTLYGYVAPRHSSGYYLVTLFFYRWEKGHYVYHKKVTARRYYYSAAKSKYLARTSLATPGIWRVRAFHSDGVHAPTYSAYRYIVVR